MKFLQLLILMALAFTAEAAKISDDTVILGLPGSTADKEIQFKDANSTKLSIDHASGDASLTGNKLIIGDGVDGDKEIILDVGQGANNPRFKFNSTKDKLEFASDGTSLKPFGSGSGSGGGENYNNVFTTDDNPNAEDGTTGWTASAGTFGVDSSDPLEGDQSFTWTPAAQNDYVDAPVLSFDKDIVRGRSCEARITYLGGDTNLTLQVLNANDTVVAELAELPAHSITGQESVFFLCPSATDISGDANKGNLRLRILNEGATAAAEIKWDKSYIGTLRGLTEMVLPDKFDVRIDSDSSIISESAEIVSSCSPNTTGDYTCLFSQSFSIEPSVGASGCVDSGTPTDTHASVYEITTSSFSYRTLSGGGSPTDRPACITISKQGADAKQSVQVYKSIPKVAENENSFSAKISSTGVVSDENIDFINGNCLKGSTGVYECPIYSGLFESKPNCTATTRLRAYSSGYVYDTSTTTNLIFGIWNTSTNSVEDHELSISCERSTDHKTPTVQPIIVGQVQNSYASSSSKQAVVESCRVLADSTTPTFSSVYCNSWLDSITRNSAGNWTIDVKPEAFSDRATCQVTSEGFQVGYLNPSSDTNSILVLLRDADGTATFYDRTFYLTCFSIE